MNRTASKAIADSPLQIFNSFNKKRRRINADNVHQIILDTH